MPAAFNMLNLGINHKKKKKSLIPYDGATLPAGVTLPKFRRVLLFAHQYNKHVQNTTKYEPNDEGDLRVGCKKCF